MQTMINKYQVEGNEFAFLSFWVCPLQIFLCWKMKLKFLKKSPSPHLAFSKADEEVDGCPHALKRLYVSVKCSPHVLSGIYTALVQNNDYHILLISTNKYWFCFDFALFIYFHIQAVFFFTDFVTAPLVLLVANMLQPLCSYNWCGHGCAVSLYICPALFQWGQWD